MEIIILLLYAIASLGLHKRLRGRLYVAPLIPLLIAAGQAGYQFYQARKQRKEADKAEKFLPPGLREAENIARAQAGATRYAGQDEDEALVRQGTADTFANISRASTSSGEIINAASKLHGAQSRAFQGIQRTGQVFRRNAMDQLRSTLASKAGAQMQARMYAENIRGAASRNEYNAINSLAGGIATAGMVSDFSKGNWNPMMMSGGSSTPMSGGMLPSTQPMGLMHPMMMSTYRWNPNAFSAGYHYRR